MIRTKQVANGIYAVYWKRQATEWRIYNASVGISGTRSDHYLIQNSKTGRSTLAGPLRRCTRALATQLAQEGR